MKKRIALSLVLSCLAGLLTPRAEASCFQMRGPRRIEAEVVSCEAPRARAEAKFDERWMTHEQIEKILSNSPPSQVVSLKVIRFQEIEKKYVPTTLEDFAGVAWTAEQKPEVKEYLVTGVASCDEYRAGQTAFFFERFTCCDTLPHVEIQCLMALPWVEPSGDG